MADARKGDFVQIHKVVLKVEQRSEHLPPSTKIVPYEGWIKGFLVDEEGSVGDEVRIRTLIGREIVGTLCRVNPVYDHNFGVPQKELLTIGDEVKENLKKG
jgi:hypothetical protein